MSKPFNKENYEMRGRVIQVLGRRISKMHHELRYLRRFKSLATPLLNRLVAEGDLAQEEVNALILKVGEPVDEIQVKI